MVAQNHPDVRPVNLVFDHVHVLQEETDALWVEKHASIASCSGIQENCLYFKLGVNFERGLFTCFKFEFLLEFLEFAMVSNISEKFDVHNLLMINFFNVEVYSWQKLLDFNGSFSSVIKC